MSACRARIAVPLRGTQESRITFHGLRTRTQRCWVHKTANVLNKLPKRLHGQAKNLLQQIWMADTKARAEQSFDLFVTTHQPKYPGAAECLSKDREALLAFYDFPAEHWLHL